jgi:16S rRNA (uracil1498-N3)-methyltransferase
MKQSKRTWLPELKPAMALIDAVREISDSTNLSNNFFVAHCMDSVSLGEKTHLLKAIIPSESTCIAIGPEGDFTSEEVQEMLNSGAKEITLGDMRLRAETAAIVAVTLFAARQV